MIKSAYIHIPFCNSICSYCDFCKLFYNKNMVSNYLKELKKEINKVYQKDTLETIYIGGGTPSCLNLDELEELFSITDKLKRNNSYEFTIECNFDSLTKEKINLFIKHGINRISFGLETTNKELSKYLNREIDLDRVKYLIDYCKQKKLTNINVDLIYALRNQKIEDIKKDLDFILKLDIPHISTYSLIIENNTMLSINKEKNISQELDYEMYKFICNYLRDNNYIHYEISNYSKEKYQSKHNLCYWNNNEYYGFGLGASSYINNKRITNTRSLTNYLKGIYIKEEEKITKKSKIEYELILNLRKKEGIDLLEFKKKYHQELIDLYDYKEIIKQGLLIEENNRLLIPENKWYISNEIIIRLLGSEAHG